MADTRGREPHLTARQREILERIAKGRTNVEIADELGIGFETVKMHVSHLFAELGVSSREEAAAWWRASRRPVARLRGILTGLASLKLVGGAAAVAGVSVIGALAVVALGDSGSSASNADRLGAASPTAPVVPTSSPTFAATANILSVSPADGSSVTGSSTVPADANTPGGVCAVVSFASLPNNFQHFRMTVDGVDVTGRLTLIASSQEATGGEICFPSREALAIGIHTAQVQVVELPTAKLLQTASWSFTIVPGGPVIEPDASYPIPTECNSDLVAAVFNRFFAAWNRGDAQTMFDLVNDSRGVWFDLGYDPLAFVSSGEVEEIHVRTLDDFKEIVMRYAGTHWTFYAQPTGSLVTNAPNAPGAVDGGPVWRLTGPAVAAAGKTMVFGSGKFGVYCDTHKLFGVMGRPTVQ